MIIRPAILEDTEALEILFQETRRNAFVTRPKSDFQIGGYTISTAEDMVWVAEEGRVIVGFVSIYLVDNFIHNLFVHPTAQGRGIGARLLDTAGKYLARPMTLKIGMDNLKVCGFYEKFGWCQKSVHKDDAKPYVLYQKD